ASSDGVASGVVRSPLTADIPVMTMWKLDSRKLVATTFLCWMSLAFGGETNWGKWGPDDQIGTLNYITPETIRHALSLVRKGEVYHLALPVEPGQPTGTARDGRSYGSIFC